MTPRLVWACRYRDQLLLFLGNKVEVCRRCNPPPHLSTIVGLVIMKEQFVFVFKMSIPTSYDIDLLPLIEYVHLSMNTKVNYVYTKETYMPMI